MTPQECDGPTNHLCGVLGVFPKFTWVSSGFPSFLPLSKNVCVCLCAWCPVMDWCPGIPASCPLFLG
ncbi:hypothetical protein PDJAM_G00046410 [Pangasius djambal]|uniref:Uncharacterized protein n=1 Tax=Pangasius djambal TaxID=1691987 RepID=A0ACC5YUS1_9TELE|nr:hypothetical protein [Pangasius djambal]